MTITIEQLKKQEVPSGAIAWATKEDAAEFNSCWIKTGASLFPRKDGSYEYFDELS